MNTRSETTPEGSGVCPLMARCPSVPVRWSGAHGPLLIFIIGIVASDNWNQEPTQMATPNWEYIFLPPHYSQHHSKLL